MDADTSPGGLTFYLGTHMPNWLADQRFADTPLFVSHWRLKDRKTMPKIRTRWALDSGGFTQLSRNPDGWPRYCEEPYVEKVYQYAAAGGLDWASQQDWMCEPWLLHGRSVIEHQFYTVDNFLRLVDMAPDLPWVPVLQGWQVDDYHRHIDMFRAAGVDLQALPVVGIGSVCRRQGTQEIVDVISSVAERGIRLHGFGVKTRGLQQLMPHLSSADSMAWSFDARRAAPLQGCCHGTAGNGNCANCPIYAQMWRSKLLSKLPQ